MSIGTPRIAQVNAPLGPRYGWLSAVGALLAGSIGAYVAMLVLEIVLAGVLHILPDGGAAGPGVGVGWPWRVDGPWSVFADLGPLLSAAVLIAVGVAYFVEGHVGRPTARWPIVVCAALFGWVPVAQAGRAGLIGVSGGLALVAMWWTTHKSAEIARPRAPGRGHPRIALAAAGVVIVGLAAASVSYGALNPVRVDVFSSPETATLRDGRTARFPISIYNEGPLPIRILAVSVSPGLDLRLIRVERAGPRTEGPTIDSLYSPAGTPRIPSGGEFDLWLTVGGPTDCVDMIQTVEALDVRVNVAGLTRTQHVYLGPSALQVDCRAARRP